MLGVPSIGPCTKLQTSNSDGVSDLAPTIRMENYFRTSKFRRHRIFESPWKARGISLSHIIVWFTFEHQPSEDSKRITAHGILSSTSILDKEVWQSKVPNQAAIDKFMYPKVFKSLYLTPSGNSYDIWYDFCSQISKRCDRVHDCMVAYLQLQRSSQG
ncbi:hypothetical protein BGZ60DRAFT_406537 [Tricladium varicosporioides]|nr:hypothetical protein BGZ60DRAFT_406537 [Hymenoscyphus varicosporioides]